MIISGLLMIALSPLWGRLLRFFPPLVTGTVITIIGISLLPVAVNWAAGGVGAEDFAAPRNLALAGGVIAIPFGFIDFSGLDDAGIAIFGTVVASGIRTLSSVSFTHNANLVIVAVSLGIGLIPVAAPTGRRRTS